MLARICLTLLLMLAVQPPSHAQTFPSGPVRIVVPFSPGGPSDLYARMLATNLTDILGKPVVVENRPGASSMIGADLVAKSKPDGHTLLFTTMSPLTSAPFLFKQVNYKLEDFAPISLIATSPYTITVRKDFPAKTLQELVAYIKANPGKVTYASVGQGSANSLLGNALARVAGADLLEVPFKGSNEVTMEIATGRLDITPDGIGGALPLVQNGQARILAVSDVKRSPVAPDVPTTVEAGYPGLIVTLAYSLLAPAGTPPDVVGQLNAAMVKAVGQKQFVDKLAADGLAAESSSPKVLADRIAEEYKVRGEMIRQFGIQPQ